MPSRSVMKSVRSRGLMATIVASGCDWCIKEMESLTYVVDRMIRTPNLIAKLMTSGTSDPGTDDSGTDMGVDNSSYIDDSNDPSNNDGDLTDPYSKSNSQTNE
jgi:hypothetical protein